jgi:hypothetical protein
MKDFIERLDLGETDILVNPAQFPKEDKNNGGAETLVIGWGLPATPSWAKWLAENMLPAPVRHVLAIDLFEREAIDGRALASPVVNAGKYWGRATQKGSLSLFLEGYYLKSTAPFGMKRVPTRRSKRKAISESQRFKLMPGEIEEIEIVRLIFDLFVNHNYSLTKICNLLNAQGVKSPHIRNVWSTNVVRTVLSSAVYIGSNEFCGCFKPGVFPPIVDRSIFFEAQAKLNQKQIALQISDKRSKVADGANPLSE